MRTEIIKEGKESEQLESVRNFFDGHAGEYQQKYQKKDTFYDYFFFERLEKATRGISFKGKSILDVGAGTGPLYDFLSSHGHDTFSKYIATDVSEGMLSQSKIPKESQYIGDLLDFELDVRFDFIFMLGVSTYLNESQMEQYLSKIKGHLQEDGLLIITFTHKNSIDIIVRNLTKPFLRLLAGRNRVLSQSFDSSYYSKSRIKKMFSIDYEIVSIDGLNHTFFPFSRIFPSISVRLAKVISRIKEGNLKYFLSSDLLVIAKNQ